MIVRAEPDGSFTLAKQTEHSQFVGYLAAHWGNATFAAPRPWESVVRAAVYHDYGWLTYEAAPKADPETGRPLNFIQSGPPLAAYRRLVEWLGGIDRYSALLVSMHRTGLWRNRYGAIEHPAMSARGFGPEIDQFVAENEAWQQEEKKAVDAALLAFNYHLLQVWDLLGLYFCRETLREEHIDPVPTALGGAAGVRLKLTPQSPARVAFEPYPFDLRPLKVQIRTKRVAGRRYSDDAEFRRAYFQAPAELLEFELM